MYLAIGIGIFVSPDFYKKLFADFVDNAAIMYLGGVTALVVGFLIVAFHNTWTRDVSVIITILGWLALIKGVLILVWPRLMVGITKAMMKKENALRIEAIAIVILGLLFSFLGFCPKSPI